MTFSAQNPEEANQKFKTLDLSGIKFPTDQLTIENLRKLFPDLFDRGFQNHQPKYFLQDEPHNPAADSGVGSAMFMERMIALCTFAKAHGLPNPSGFEDVDSFKTDLIQFYCQHGLARGEHQASELVRSIESQINQLSSLRGL